MTHPGERVQIDVKVVPRRCIADKELRLYQYTAIDEYSRYRILGAYPEQSTYSSADFLRKVVSAFSRKGIKVECVQTDNGFEFTNRFSNSKKDIGGRIVQQQDLLVADVEDVAHAQDEQDGEG